MTSTITEPPVARWLTVPDALAYTQIKSPRTIYRAVEAGQLRAAKIGARGFRFRREWLDAWLEQTASPEEIRPRG